MTLSSDDEVRAFLTHTSVGAIGLPEVWYAVHGLWIRAATLFLLRSVVAFVYFEVFWSHEVPISIALEIAVWSIYWVPVVLLARSARDRVWSGRIDADDVHRLEDQERNWSIIGSVLIAVFVLQMLWWWTS